MEQMDLVDYVVIAFAAVFIVYLVVNAIKEWKE
jgi:hypothetical protein